MILTFIWWIAIAGAGITTIAIIALLAFGGENNKFTIESYAILNLDPLQAETASGEVVEVSVSETVPVEIGLPVRSARGNAYYLFTQICSAIIIFGIVLYSLKQLREIVKTAEAGDPFISINAKRLRILGFLTIGFSILGGIYEIVVGVIVNNMFRPEGFILVSQYQLDLATLVAGLCILALSEVFRQGAVMREEQALTI
ncbi:MAG: DUF2975 domain-containing protein [Verrucomicrobiota bacterium]